MLTRIIVIMLAALASAAVIASAFAEDQAKRRVTVVFDHALPNVPGKSMKGVLVEYGPGGSSRSHKHPASAFIYATVLEGAIRSQVNDGPVKVYRAGENWVEQPGDHHRVSANASDSEPAKLLAVFVVDTGEKNIVIDDPQWDQPQAEVPINAVAQRLGRASSVVTLEVYGHVLKQAEDRAVSVEGSLLASALADS